MAQAGGCTGETGLCVQSGDPECTAATGESSQSQGVFLPTSPFIIDIITVINNIIIFLRLFGRGLVLKVGLLICSGFWKLLLASAAAGVPPAWNSVFLANYLIVLLFRVHKRGRSLQ